MYRYWQLGNETGTDLLMINDINKLFTESYGLVTDELVIHVPSMCRLLRHAEDCAMVNPLVTSWHTTDHYSLDNESYKMWCSLLRKAISVIKNHTQPVVILVSVSTHLNINLSIYPAVFRISSVIFLQSIYLCISVQLCFKLASYIYIKCLTIYDIIWYHIWYMI